jgi:hypothetical protein
VIACILMQAIAIGRPSGQGGTKCGDDQDGGFGASMRLGGFGHSVCASTDRPSCCTVGAADCFSPPASGRIALRSIGWRSGGSGSFPAEPVVVPLGAVAAGGQGLGTCDHAELAKRVITTAAEMSLVMVESFKRVAVTNSTHHEKFPFRHIKIDGQRCAPVLPMRFSARSGRIDAA